jgi:hypothetical protein
MALKKDAALTVLIKVSNMTPIVSIAVCWWLLVSLQSQHIVVLQYVDISELFSTDLQALTETETRI